MIPHRTSLAGHPLTKSETALVREVEAARADLATARAALEAEVEAHDKTRRRMAVELARANSVTSTLCLANRQMGDLREERDRFHDLALHLAEEGGNFCSGGPT
jgi:hypothetical protein